MAHHSRNRSLRIWLPTIRARSGSDVYVERLAEALTKIGHEPIIQWFPHRYQYYPWRLKSVEPPAGTDLVQANSWNAFAFKRKDIPLVVVVLHCVFKQGYPAWKSLGQAVFHNVLVGKFERSSFNAANAITAISKSTAEEIASTFGTRDAVPIPLWVDTAKYDQTSREYDSTRSKTHILIVGNMGKRKGGDLIEPFCKALGEDFEVTVVTGLRGSVPKRSGRAGNLSFKRGLSNEELIDEYHASDIVVSLSRHEGFGYTALEGMLCRKPVVAFDVSGLRDVIADGLTGLLAPKEDVESLADACKSLRENPGKMVDFGLRGRQRAADLFAEEKNVNDYLDLYCSVIKGRHFNTR